MDTMNTLSEVMNKLKVQGYESDLNLKGDCLICAGTDLQIYPEDFQVDQIYRFEGTSDPGDEAIVYAISSEKHKVKGVLVNGYGIYTDDATDEMMKALDLRKHT